MHGCDRKRRLRKSFPCRSHYCLVKSVKKNASNNWFIFSLSLFMAQQLIVPHRNFVNWDYHSIISPVHWPVPSADTILILQHQKWIHSLVEVTIYQKWVATAQVFIGHWSPVVSCRSIYLNWQKSKLFVFHSQCNSDAIRIWAAIRQLLFYCSTLLLNENQFVFVCSFLNVAISLRCVCFQHRGRSSAWIERTMNEPFINPHYTSYGIR